MESNDIREDLEFELWVIDLMVENKQLHITCDESLQPWGAKEGELSLLLGVEAFVGLDTLMERIDAVPEDIEPGSFN